MVRRKGKKIPSPPARDTTPADAQPTARSDASVREADETKVRLALGDKRVLRIGNHRITIDLLGNDRNSEPGDRDTKIAAGPPGQMMPSAPRFAVQGLIHLDLVDLELTERDWHRSAAERAQATAWQLLDMTDLDAPDDINLLSAAHTARHEWTAAADQLEVARADWLLSRAYVRLGAPHLALAAAERCCLVMVDLDADNYDLAIGYEAMARSLAASGDHQQALRYLRQATDAGAALTGSDEREQFAENLAAEPWFGLR